MTTLEEALKTLRANETALRARGIVHAAIFGSVARGDARPESDVDIMVEIDAAKHVGIFEFVGLRAAITQLLGREVDLVESKALKPLVKEEAMRERVHAF